MNPLNFFVQYQINPTKLNSYKGKQNMKRLLVLLALTCFLTSGLFGQKLSETESLQLENEVLKVNAEMVKAAEAKDLEKLFSFVLENDRGAVVQGGIILLTRAEVMESTRNSFQGLVSINYRMDNEYVTALSPTLALLIADGLTTFTLEDGRTISRAFAQSILFSRQDDKWKVLHAHRSFPANR